MSADRSGELHPVLSPERRAELVAEGVGRFNGGEFFAAHEAWEEIWRSTTPEPRELFQGLVQVAAAFHHFADRRRPDVARRVLGKGRRRLEGCGGEGAGLDLEGFLVEVRSWEAWLADPAAADAENAPRPAYPTLRTSNPG